MIAIAANEKNGQLLIKDIAVREGISDKYLSQIIIPLKSKGLVSTTRGAHSGYVLGRPASRITLGDIIETLEGDIRLVDREKKPEPILRGTAGVAQGIWNELNELVANFYNSMTLETIMERYKKMITDAGDTNDFSI